MTHGADAPIFILGHARSGTTLLRCILDAHPRVSAPPETFLGRLGHSLCQYFCSTSNGRSGWGESVRTPEALAFARGILASRLERYARERGKVIWCEKTPENVLFLDTVVALFPDARYICLHRHCLDVAHSWNELVGPASGLHDQFRGHSDNPCRAILSWNDHTARLLRFERSGSSSSHRLLYEHLVTRPREAVTALLTYLELEGDAADLVERAFVTSHDVGYGCPKAISSTRISADAIGKGLNMPIDALSVDQFEEMNRLLLELGYATAPRRRSDGQGPAASALDTDTGTGTGTDTGTGDEERREVAEWVESIAAKASEAGKGTLWRDVTLVLGDPSSAQPIPAPGVMDGAAGSTSALSTIVVSPGTLRAILSNRLNAGEAFLQGRLRVIGNTMAGLEFCQVLVRAANVSPATIGDSL